MVRQDSVSLAGVEVNRMDIINRRNDITITQIANGELDLDEYSDEADGWNSVHVTNVTPGVNDSPGEITLTDKGTGEKHTFSPAELEPYIGVVLFHTK